MRKKKTTKEEVRDGLKRLAFGDITDAVLLLFAGDTFSEEKLRSLDLFCVSEIKKVRAGGTEIKFFDRQKAMERLYELSAQEDTQGLGFYAALEKSAAAAGSALDACTYE